MKLDLKGEIEALVSLLDDPDNNVSLPVTNKLIQMGVPILQILDNYWENTTNHLRRERIDNIIVKIQHDQSVKNIKDWADCGGEELLYGTYLVEKIHFPSLIFSEFEKKLKTLSKQVWLELNNRLTAFEKIRVLNHFVFDIHKFSTEREDVLSPNIYLVNQLLKTHKGHPLALSILYAAIAEQLELPVYRVNIPGYHLLCYKDKTHLSSSEEIMFYINPVSGGNILGKAAVEDFLVSKNVEYRREQLLPVNKIEFLMELLRELYNTYALIQDKDKAVLLLTIIEKIKASKMNQSL